ncbi:hypothetical protein [Mucilaginibacter koreensis]
MIYDIQPAIQCENCVKCGSRPVIEQTKKEWIVKCPNKQCANEVKSTITDINLWNHKNKPKVELNTVTAALKNTA